MKTVIIEDEPMAAARLQKMVLHLSSSIRVLAVIESAADAILWFEQNRMPDLVFIDFELSDGTCFEIFDAVKIHCPVIFTTAYDEKVLKLLHGHSADCLLKPVSLRQLRQSFAKIVERSSCKHSRVEISNPAERILGKGSK